MPTEMLNRPAVQAGTEPTTQPESQSSNRPQLSVVIASVNGPSYLNACLAALEHQRGDVQAEVIVADCCGRETANMVATRYPWVRMFSFEERLAVPVLRAIGINHSRGDLVVMTEDHCVPPDDWYERIVQAHAERPYLAIGGAIENAATDRLVDWAVFLCEYSDFVGPLQPGVAQDIPGPNVAYKREALAHMQDLLDAGQWETFLHARLKERGFELYRDPRVMVYHRKFFGLGEFLSQRYHYGRGFAGMRVDGAPFSRKVLFAGGTPILPPLILSRIGRRLFGRRRHRTIFLKTLPLLVLFTLSWTVGEFVGYLAGPGDSLARVE